MLTSPELEARSSCADSASAHWSFGELGVDVGDSGTWPACMIGQGLLIIDGHTDGKTHGGVPGSG
jgi:hypothetical protein